MTALNELHSKALIVEPFDTRFALEVFFPGRKRNIDNDNVCDRKLICRWRLDIGPAKADILQTSFINLVPICENDI
ncbi:hypothetical protein DESC_370071 [Desulfosarcina cetonica]|nr:hypothetical protein DESC_370071 [Desulfosarcina cetonica]